jgi:hypothetical protein
MYLEGKLYPTKSYSKFTRPNSRKPLTYIVVGVMMSSSYGYWEGKMPANLNFLGLWEGLHNPDFKPLEFEGFRNQAGANAFTMSPKKWIDATAAIGIVSKSGRYGGTFAHSDIAFEFASWISPEFKLYFTAITCVSKYGEL